jgi:TetR/AcrR family transcriptional regulator
MEYTSETEQKIFEAAREIFIQQGHDGARMEEIANKAGINKALLHYYFRSKNKLYQEVFRREVRQLLSDLIGSINLNLDIKDLLKLFISNYLDRLHDNPLVVRFFLWEIRSGGHHIKEILQPLLDSENGPVPRKLVLKFEKAISRREIRNLDPYHLVFNLISMCIYTFIAEPVIEVIFPEIDVRDDTFIDQRKNEIFNLIWQGIKP